MVQSTMVVLRYDARGQQVFPRARIEADDDLKEIRAYLHGEEILLRGDQVQIARMLLEEERRRMRGEQPCEKYERKPGLE